MQPRLHSCMCQLSGIRTTALIYNVSARWGLSQRAGWEGTESISASKQLLPDSVTGVIRPLTSGWNYCLEGGFTHRPCVSERAQQWQIESGRETENVSHLKDVAQWHGAMREAMDKERLQQPLYVVEGVTHTGQTGKKKAEATKWGHDHISEQEWCEALQDKSAQYDYLIIFSQLTWSDKGIILLKVKNRQKKVHFEMWTGCMTSS